MFLPQNTFATDVWNNASLDVSDILRTSRTDA